ncbi:response regulator [Vibrio porteresiae]|uniref:Transcriptional regulatory protein n=1 Tax=Vibrio porteresiae DSM 19223 TaxID=1123496 RepID=A0ABZ0QHB1_9VIBR|nr:response regulator [Vibrio porteresiae]WPC75587.1 response regulator [Vibrio porteresiae DSM 19223]
MTKISVMILEDDLRASYMLESTVNQDSDFSVVAVSESYAQALLQYSIYQPALIFVDITLPDGHGIEFIQRMRKQGAQCDFIITTADRETSTVAKAVQLGVSDYLVKPIRISRVHQALNDYKLYRQQLQSNTTVDQGDIDALLRKTPQKEVRQTPKGIDATTLATLKTLLMESRFEEFSAEDIGERMQVSRITARRYLEFLESEGIVNLVLNYNTGGRPRRLYRLVS